MVNVDGKNSGHYGSLDMDFDEIIIKKVDMNEWSITKKIHVEDEKVKTMNFTDYADWFSLDFSSRKTEVLPSEVGFDSK